MKTKPAKLLMAMLLGMSSMALVSTSVLAGDDNSSHGSGGDDHSHSSGSDDQHSGSSSSSTPSCTGQPMSACGLNIVKITCTGSAISTSSKDKSGHEEGDDSHDSTDKDSSSKNDRDHNDDMHSDHKDRSQGSNKQGDGKISICHRMGGAEVSLTVANDGYASGHSKHDLDTIGRCSDFDTDKSSDDSKTDKNKDHKISLSDTGYRLGVTTTQIACLKGPSNTSYTIGGTTYPGANLNGSNVSVVIKGLSQSTNPTSSQGANQGSNSSSSRGGAKNLY